MNILSRLYVHPVQFMRRLQLSHALVDTEGLAFDSFFMLTDADVPLLPHVSIRKCYSSPR